MARRARRHRIETRGDRAAIAHSAGMGRVSLVSVLAGTLVAYGAFAVLLAITAAVARSAGLETDLSTNEWRELGVVGGLLVAGVLFLCYLFGGYVAGRMARRAGATNGALVFVVSLLVALGVTGLVNVFTDGDDILRNLRNIGLPTSGEEWSDLGTVAGIASLLAILVGAVVGGGLGERWHGKLLARAADPGIGPQADAEAEVELRRAELREAEERARAQRQEGQSQVVTAAVPERSVLDRSEPNRSELDRSEADRAELERAELERRTERRGRRERRRLHTSDR